MNLELRDDEKINSMKEVCSKIDPVNKQVIKLVIDHIKRLKSTSNISVETILSFLFQNQIHIIESIQILYLYSNFDFILLNPQPYSQVIPKKKSKEVILNRLKKESIGKMPNSVLIDRDIETEGFSFKSSYHDGNTDDEEGEFRSAITLNTNGSYQEDLMNQPLPPAPAFSPTTDRSTDNSFDLSKGQSEIIRKMIEINQGQRNNSFVEEDELSLDSTVQDTFSSSGGMQKRMNSIELNEEEPFEINKM